MSGGEDNGAAGRGGAALRVGFLSAAHLHADGYVENFRAAGAEVVGVADHDGDRGAAWASRHGVPWLGSPEALLAAGVDAVAVCSETVHHRALVEVAAQAGAAVLCEKPLATTEEDAEAIVAACARAGVPLMTAFPMRFSPPMREVATLLAGGALGRVYSCTGTNQGEVPVRHGAWFGEVELSGGGAVMDHSVHVADVLRWYLGQDPVEVYAATNRIMNGQEIAVETGALLLLTYADGTFATIDASWSRPADYPTWGGLTLELVGEGGSVAVDAFSQRLSLYGGPRGPVSWLPWGSDANQGMVEEFLAAARERRTPAVTGEDGLAATRIALAAYRSAREGQPVRLGAGARAGA